MERAYQGRVIKQIGLVCSEQSKDNQRIAEFVDQREVIILDQIGYDQIKQIIFDQ